MSKEYGMKTKIEQPNDYKLQSKMLFLLGYNLKMVISWGRGEFTFGGGGGDKNLVGGRGGG